MCKALDIIRRTIAAAVSLGVLVLVVGCTHDPRIATTTQPEDTRPTINVIARDEQGNLLGPVDVSYHALQDNANFFTPIEHWTRESGESAIRLPAAGEYEVLVRGSLLGRAFVRMTIAVAEHDNRTIDVVVPLGGRIVLHVKDAAGRYIPDVHVRTNDETGRRVQPGFGKGYVDGADYYEVILGAVSAESYRILPPGQYDLLITHATYEEARHRVRIVSGDDTVVTVELSVR